MLLLSGHASQWEVNGMHLLHIHYLGGKQKELLISSRNTKLSLRIYVFDYVRRECERRPEYRRQQHLSIYFTVVKPDC